MIRRNESNTVTFWQTLLVVCVILGGWLFYEALRAREAAIRITKEACKQHGLQLLDDTVHGVRLRSRSRRRRASAPDLPVRFFRGRGQSPLGQCRDARRQSRI